LHGSEAANGSRPRFLGAGLGQVVLGEATG